MNRVASTVAAIAVGLSPIGIGVAVAHGASAADRHGYVTASHGYTFDGTTGVLTCPAEHPGKPAVLKVWSIPTEGRQVPVSSLPISTACKGYPAVIPDGACQWDVTTDGSPSGWVAGQKGLCGTPPTTSTTTATGTPTTPTSTETTTWPTSPAPTTHTSTTTSSTPTGTTTSTETSTPRPPASTTPTGTAPAPQRPTNAAGPARPTNAAKSSTTCATGQQYSTSTPDTAASASVKSPTSCAAQPISSTLPQTGTDATDVLVLGGALIVIGLLIGAALWLEGWMKRGRP